MTSGIYAYWVNEKGYNNKQKYCIRCNGKVLKQSVHIEKLEEWFKDNYPNVELIKGV